LRVLASEWLKLLRLLLGSMLWFPNYFRQRIENDVIPNNRVRQLKGRGTTYISTLAWQIVKFSTSMYVCTANGLVWVKGDVDNKFFSFVLPTYILPTYLQKIGGFYSKYHNYWRKNNNNIGFQENRTLFSRKLVKVAENSHLNNCFK
jgi:hypothetical protein